MTTIMVTGCAGFVGAAITAELLRRGERVVGIDNLNNYYDPVLKQTRLKFLLKHHQFQFYCFDLIEKAQIESVFIAHQPQQLIHLAAQPGVRYSIQNPEYYLQNNIVSFANLLECCRQQPPEHIVFASSSSVYGNNRELPLATEQHTEEPLNIYAASKKSNELMAYVYSQLYHLPITGLRYFTVYGPWGRPDMAPTIFTKRILTGMPISVYNHGQHLRDFTYIDDIIDGTLRVLDQIPKATIPYHLYNLGYGKPIQIINLIKLLEEYLEHKAIIEMKIKQPGDMENTWADITPLTEKFGYQPKTNIEQGLFHYIRWHQDYYLKRPPLS